MMPPLCFLLQIGVVALLSLPRLILLIFCGYRKQSLRNILGFLFWDLIMFADWLKGERNEQTVKF